MKNIIKLYQIFDNKSNFCFNLYILFIYLTLIFLVEVLSLLGFKIYLE